MASSVVGIASTARLISTRPGDRLRAEEADDQPRNRHAQGAGVDRDTHRRRRHVIGLVSDGRIACVAKRSTTVRNAVRPMTSERSAAPGDRPCGAIVCHSLRLKSRSWQASLRMRTRGEDVTPGRAGQTRGSRASHQHESLWGCGPVTCCGRRIFADVADIEIMVSLPRFFHQCEVPNISA